MARKSPFPTVSGKRSSEESKGPTKGATPDAIDFAVNADQAFRSQPGPGAQPHHVHFHLYDEHIHHVHENPADDPSGVLTRQQKGMAAKKPVSAGAKALTKKMASPN